jgi:hypothetical protein
MRENLPFVNNTTNHQNVPQARLIENLRGIGTETLREWVDGHNAAGVD